MKKEAKAKKGEKDKSFRSKQGRKNRAAGVRFELKVRTDMERRGWILDKWTNNIDTEKWILIKAKRKYNPFLKALSIGTGFPDFIAFKQKRKDYDIMGIEVKRNGWLDRMEKEKCKWYLKNKIFSKILIAKKGEKRGKIDYIDFAKKDN